MTRLIRDVKQDVAYEVTEPCGAWYTHNSVENHVAGTPYLDQSSGFGLTYGSYLLG